MHINIIFMTTPTQQQHRLPWPQGKCETGPLLHGQRHWDSWAQLTLSTHRTARDLTLPMPHYTTYKQWLTQRDWSQRRSTNNWVRSVRRTCIEQTRDTCTKHSAHALRTPQIPSSQRQANLDNCTSQTAHWAKCNIRCILQLQQQHHTIIFCTHL